MSQAPLISTHGLSKAYPGVKALDRVDFDLRAGEVHVLFGENGAGKTTLISLLAGANMPSEGEIRMHGQPLSLASVSDAQHRGIYTVFQEFSLIPTMSVAANIFLGREPKIGPFIDHRGMRREAARMLAERGFEMDPSTTVAQLARAQQQMVEIAKAFHGDLSVLILDEPTASLSDREVDNLFDFVLRMKAAGLGIIYISHRIDEFARIADRVTVLRDGRKVLEAPAAGLSADAMAEAMVGRELSDLFPPRRPGGEDIVLEVRGLRVEGLAGEAGFSLRRGEVLGFAGLVGSGRTELMEGIVGLRPATGEVLVEGAPIAPGSVLAARRAGLVYLTEDRKEKGLLLGKNLRENLTLLALDRFSSRGLIDGEAEEAALDRAFAEFDIRAGDRSMAAGNLSGGNQQKLLLAKIMLAEPGIVIIDEPTRGIDIGTKQQIYGFIRRLADGGRSVIVVSSELTEVIGLASRVVVMAAGRIAGTLEGEAVNESAIVRLAMGMDKREALAS